MKIDKRSPIRLDIKPVPESLLMCEFMTKGQKHAVKINVYLAIYCRRSGNSGVKKIDFINSETHNIYTSTKDELRTIKIKVPDFDVKNRIESYILISIDNKENYHAEAYIESIIVEEYHQYINRKNKKEEEFKKLIERLKNKNGKLNIVCEGLMLGHSGFAKAMRNVTFGLDKFGCNIKTIVLDEDNICTARTEKGKRILQLSNNSNSIAYDPSFWITMNFPLGVRRHDNYYSIGYIMFETEDFPNAFTTHLTNNIDEIWTPSTFCKNSMEKTGLGNIHVIPLGVDEQLFNPKKVEINSRVINCPFDTIDGKYIFLTVCGYSERKGISILVRAFAEEFAGHGDVVLYIKGGWYNPTKALQEVNDLISTIKNPPYIHIDFHIYPDDILAQIYKMADAFVLPSRGEGWCILPDSPILTLDRGVQKIKDIKIGENVLTHRGRFMRIINVMSRKYNGDIVKITSHKLEIPLMLTPEHRVLAIKANWLYTVHKTEWIMARELQKGDFVVYPRVNEKEIDIEKIRILDYIDDSLGHNGPFGNIVESTIDTNHSTMYPEMPVEVDLTKDLMRLFGYFIAKEDICEDRQIEFSFNINEHRYIEDVERIIKDIFKFDAEHVKKENNVYILRYSNRILNIMFKNILCPDEYKTQKIKGDKTNVIRIPSEFLSLPKDKLSELIKGIWRGYREKDRKGTKGYVIGTTSDTLAYQLLYILSKFNILSSIRVEKREFPTEDKFPIENKYVIEITGDDADIFDHIIEENFRNVKEENREYINREYIKGKDLYFIPIKDIEIIKYDGYVWNLGIEKDNSYSCPIIVHNCLPCIESMAMELPTIGTRWGGHLDFMNDDNSFLIDIEGTSPEPRCNWVTSYYVGRKFAVPNKNHLRQLMRYVYENRKEGIEKGKKARKYILKNYTWDISCKKMYNRLKDIVDK